MAKEATIAREASVNPINAIRSGFSSFGDSFDSGTAFQSRQNASQALNNATIPELYGSTSLNFGEQGAATIRRTGTERKGELRTHITVNGGRGGDSVVEYGRNRTLEQAFEETKRRIKSYIKT